MAVYRLSASIVSRGAGRSAIAAAAYRAADVIVEHTQAFSQALAAAAYRAGAVLTQDGERDGKAAAGLVHDYSRKQGVVHSEILAPAAAPVWMHDRERLWNAVEASEKRQDAQLARELQLALPRELGHQQQLDLVRGFAQAQLVARGMVVDLALHDTKARDGDRQPHAHLLLTMRSLDQGSRTGFGNKDRSWNSKTLLQGWRANWAEHVNRALEEAQRPERVDHRTLEAQREEALQRGDWDRAAALDREPEPKLGPGTLQLERQGVVTERGEAWREAQDRNDLRRDAYELVDSFGPQARAPFLELRAQLGDAIDAFMAWTKEAYAHAREWLQERVQPPLERVAELGGASREAFESALTSLRELGRSFRPTTPASGLSDLELAALPTVPEQDQPQPAGAEGLDLLDASLRQLERAQQAMDQALARPITPSVAGPSLPAARQEQDREQEPAKTKDRDLDLDFGY